MDSGACLTSLSSRAEKSMGATGRPQADKAPPAPNPQTMLASRLHWPIPAACLPGCLACLSLSFRFFRTPSPLFLHPLRTTFPPSHHLQLAQWTAFASRQLPSQRLRDIFFYLAFSLASARGACVYDRLAADVSPFAIDFALLNHRLGSLTATSTFVRFAAPLVAYTSSIYHRPRRQLRLNSRLRPI